MKITPEIAERINELYSEIGVKKKVAEIIGCSPSTVSRYIVPNFVPQKARKTYTFDGYVGNADWMIDIFETFEDGAARFCELCMLGQNEWEEMRQLQIEIYL